MLLLFHPFFFFIDTATTEIYTLSLHDALPILAEARSRSMSTRICGLVMRRSVFTSVKSGSARMRSKRTGAQWYRSEEHTSELQSRFDLVCRLLLEKKKKNTKRAN